MPELPVVNPYSLRLMNTPIVVGSMAQTDEALISSAASDESTISLCGHIQPAAPGDTSAHAARQGSPVETVESVEEQLNPPIPAVEDPTMVREFQDKEVDATPPQPNPDGVETVRRTRAVINWLVDNVIDSTGANTLFDSDGLPTRQFFSQMIQGMQPIRHAPEFEVGPQARPSAPRAEMQAYYYRQNSFHAVSNRKDCSITFYLERGFIIMLAVLQDGFFRTEILQGRVHAS
ncbi:hypothetical protein BC835DRAFT_1311762 [Cytidiella melzeri]|nr:hypothetical protein BC835DRAFT_1311762 [Cytidiella melzeri]